MKTTILIVEDEEIILQALKTKLSSAGINVLIAQNGQEGLEAALEYHPDLILLDIVMPVMDGLAMLQKLREDKWGKDVPVIVLSNLSEPVKISQAMEDGVTDYLIKTDWKIDDLVQLVKQKSKSK